MHAHTRIPPHTRARTHISACTHMHALRSGTVSWAGVRTPLSAGDPVPLVHALSLTHFSWGPHTHSSDTDRAPVLGSGASPMRPRLAGGMGLAVVHRSPTLPGGQGSRPLTPRTRLQGPCPPGNQSTPPLCGPTRHLGAGPGGGGAGGEGEGSPRPPGPISHSGSIWDRVGRRSPGGPFL